MSDLVDPDLQHRIDTVSTMYPDLPESEVRRIATELEALGSGPGIVKIQSRCWKTDAAGNVTGNPPPGWKPAIKNANGRTYPHRVFRGEPYSGRAYSVEFQEMPKLKDVPSRRINHET